MKKVTIERSKWTRPGLVFNERVVLWGKHCEAGCCLGHILHKAHRMPLKHMRGLELPRDVAMSMNKKNPLVTIDKSCYEEYYSNGDFAKRASRINDNRFLTGDQREKHLIKLGKQHGYELEFVD